MSLGLRPTSLRDESAEAPGRLPPVTLKDVLTLAVAAIAAAIALATFVKALIEYQQQGRQKRADRFFELRERLKGREEFLRLAELLDAGAIDDAAGRAANFELQETPFRVKREYLGLFEEVALAVNSGLVGLNVAHYMFGYYAILCQRSEAFWSGVNRLSPYWALFNDFCEQMKNLGAEFASGHYAFRRGEYRF